MVDCRQEVVQKTGLGEINGDLLERDFWPSNTFRLPVAPPETNNLPTPLCLYDVKTCY